MDLAVIETGNGGDIQFVGRDLSVIFGIENQTYLAMFGGNVEASTENPTSGQAQKALDFSWWGNTLLMGADTGQQFNSLTERALNTIPLTSEGRVQIEDAIKTDLKFLKDLGKLTVTVTIVDDDEIIVDIKLEMDVNIKVTTINFKKSSNGDWLIADFNSTDFVI